MPYEIRTLTLAAMVMVAGSGSLLLDVPPRATDRGEKRVTLTPAIAFVSTRHDPAGGLWNATEVTIHWQRVIDDGRWNG